MANCLDSRPSCARLQSAGISLRLVKSPLAPKITITQGAPTGLGSKWFTLMNEALPLRPNASVRAFSRHVHRTGSAWQTKVFLRNRLHPETRIFDKEQR